MNMIETSIFPSYVIDKESGWRADIPANITKGCRVLCLYRVSTSQQLYMNDKKEADIPMQKKRCRRFCEEHGWTIVCELQEEGVSGHKVRAENRDKIRVIKEYAQKQLFDILLVYMFDRIGRIADETPFVVEWLIRHGIRVWSAEEGEQRIESHADKLMNYIRYWQADGESEKTSIRTANSMGILTEEGCFTGGACAYGYKLVKTGRTNKRKQEVHDLAICEEEACVVRKIFRHAAEEGYGAQRIANRLNAEGIKNRSGKNWHPSSIQAMLRNILYIGILRSGNSRSKQQEHLQIIDDKSFEAVQRMLTARARINEDKRTVPLNTRGNSLLAGNIFCGHCGARLSITTNGQGRVRSDGTERIRTRYTCQTKSRTHGDCDGQTGYGVETVDRDVDAIIRSILSKVRRLTRTEVMTSFHCHDVAVRHTALRKVEKDAEKAQETLKLLQVEVIKSVIGETEFSTDMLKTAYAEQENRCAELKDLVSRLKSEQQKEEERIKEIGELYDEMLEWSYAYDKASMAAKKMIVSHMIERVEVHRGYQYQIKFKISIEQFLVSLTEAA